MKVAKFHRMSFKVWSIFLFFSLIGTIVYYNAIKNPFFYDDIHHITTNPHIRTLSSIPSFFTDSRTFSNVKSGGGEGLHYRPLVMLTYSLNYWLGRLNPAGYHIVNLGFHVGSAFLLFLVVYSLLNRAFFAALAAGLIFLVHPFN